MNSNAATYYRTAFKVASKYLRQKIFQNERFPDYFDFDQLIKDWTLLDHAIMGNPNSELVKILASNGAKLGNYAFAHEIQCGGSIEVIKKFIELGANVNQKWIFEDGNRHFPLEKAIQVGRKDIVKLLLESLANPKPIHDHSYLLKKAILVGHKDILKLLLDSGANLNPKQDHSYLISLAIERYNMDIVEMLIGYGANVNLPPNVYNHARAPLNVAVESGFPKFVKLLIEKGAEVEYPLNRPDDLSPLQTALKNYADFEIFEILIESGANIELQDEFKNTPLHLAVKVEANEEDFYFYHFIPLEKRFVKTLLAYGAKCNAKNKENNIPFELSLKNAFKGKDDPEDDEYHGPGDQTFKLFMYHQHCIDD